MYAPNYDPDAVRKRDKAFARYREDLLASLELDRQPWFARAREAARVAPGGGPVFLEIAGEADRILARLKTARAAEGARQRRRLVTLVLAPSAAAAVWSFTSASLLVSVGLGALAFTVLGWLWNQVLGELGPSVDSLLGEALTAAQRVAWGAFLVLAEDQAGALHLPPGDSRLWGPATFSEWLESPAPWHVRVTFADVATGFPAVSVERGAAALRRITETAWSGPGDQASAEEREASSAYLRDIIGEAWAGKVIAGVK